MSSVIFVADLFVDQHLGGAELNDHTLVTWLKETDRLFERKNSSFLTEKYILENRDKKFIISNFARLHSTAPPALALTDYIIYEHDYKFLSNRNPIDCPDFKVPDSSRINLNFYKNAQAVICLSKMHREIFEKNMSLHNLMNIHCSLFDNEKIDLLLELAKTPKSKKYAVIDDTNPTKKTQQTITWCHQHNIEFDLISHQDNKEFLKILSEYENLVFMPGHPEPTPRIAVETKLMGVNLIAPKRLIGVAHEYWWGWEASKIAEELRTIREAAFKMFVSLLK